MTKNPLNSYINDSIIAFQKEMFHKISKWHVMVASSNIRIETFDGRTISIQGGDYSGTVMSLFWDFFDPFIKDYISKTVEQIREKSEEACVDTKVCLNIFSKNMCDAVDRIYQKIAETDRLMRGKGYPNKVSLRPIDDKAKFLHQYIHEKVNDQIMIVKYQKRNKIKAFLIEHINGIIVIVLITIYFLCEKLGWASLGKFMKMLLEKV